MVISSILFLNFVGVQADENNNVFSIATIRKYVSGKVVSGIIKTRDQLYMSLITTSGASYCNYYYYNLSTSKTPGLKYPFEVQSMRDQLGEVSLI